MNMTRATKATSLSASHSPRFKSSYQHNKPAPRKRTPLNGYQLDQMAVPPLSDWMPVLGIERPLRRSLRYMGQLETDSLYHLTAQAETFFKKWKFLSPETQNWIKNRIQSGEKPKHVKSFFRIVDQIILNRPNCTDKVAQMINNYPKDKSLAELLFAIQRRDFRFIVSQTKPLSSLYQFCEAQLPENSHNIRAPQQMIPKILKAMRGIKMVLTPKQRKNLVAINDYLQNHIHGLALQGLITLKNKTYTFYVAQILKNHLILRSGLSLIHLTMFLKLVNYYEITNTWDEVEPHLNSFSLSRHIDADHSMSHITQTPLFFEFFFWTILNHALGYGTQWEPAQDLDNDNFYRTGLHPDFYEPIGEHVFEFNYGKVTSNKKSFERKEDQIDRYIGQLKDGNITSFAFVVAGQISIEYVHMIFEKAKKAGVESQVKIVIFDKKHLTIAHVIDIDSLNSQTDEERLQNRYFIKDADDKNCR